MVLVPFGVSEMGVASQALRMPATATSASGPENHLPHSLSLLESIRTLAGNPAEQVLASCRLWEDEEDFWSGLPFSPMLRVLQRAW